MLPKVLHKREDLQDLKMSKKQIALSRRFVFGKLFLQHTPKAKFTLVSATNFVELSNS